MNAITQEKWDKMNEKAKWDTIAALRGPDCRHSDVIKWFATSVIRGCLSGVMRVGGLVNKDLSLVVIPTGDLPRQDNPSHPHQWDYNHYFQHVGEAATWLGLPVVRIGAKEYLEYVNGGLYSLTTTCQGFITYLEARAENIKKVKIKATPGDWQEFHLIMDGSSYIPKSDHIAELKRHAAAIKAGAY
jgi:hypothetical protein